VRIFVTVGAGFTDSNFFRYTLGCRPAVSIVNYDKLTYAGNLANLETIANRLNYSFVPVDVCDPTGGSL
jgi:dTDP-glucose 4,6-dehydratase